MAPTYCETLTPKISNYLALFLLLTGFLGAQEPAMLSGFISDAGSGENIYGANVYLQKTTVGSVSNIEGYYVLSDVAPGKYVLVVSFIGFQEYNQEVVLQPGERKVLDIALEPNVLQGETVQVTGKHTAFKRQVQLSKVSLDPRQIAAVPQVGEVDLFRALQQLPGVNAESDFSSGLIIRGGDSDQNLVLLDGITVYNPSHLLGMFSNFITDGLRDVELLKGGYPAEYGGRLSSVVNVHSKEGNQKSFNMNGEVSMVSSKFLMEGPIRNGAWLVTGRRTYLDKMLDAFRALNLTTFDLPYYFYDLQANIFQNLSASDRLSVSAYLGDDVLDWIAANMHFSWGNQTLSSRFRHVFSPRLFSNFMVAHSRFDIRSQLGGDEALRERDVILDITTKGDLTYYAGGEREIKFGFEAKKLHISYISWFGEEEQFRLQQHPFYTGIYGQLNWHPSKWVLVTGLRLNYYDAARRKFHLAPRFSLKRILGEKTSLTFSLNRYYQNIFALNDEFNMKIMNAWIAQDTTVNTPYSNEAIVGFKTTLPSATTVSVESYYKRMYNLYVFKNEIASYDQTIIDPRAADFFEPTDAEAFGLEFLLEHAVGRVNGQVSYTRSWVIKQIKDEPRYWANWDRRDNLKVVANWRINKKWDFGSSLDAYTGIPYTPILGFYTYYEPGYSTPLYIEIPGDRNSQRLPFYQRLDVAITRHYRFTKWDLDVKLNIINLLNHKNYFRVTYNTSPLKEGEPPEQIRLQLLPFLPTLGVRAQF